MTDQPEYPKPLDDADRYACLQECQAAEWEAMCNHCGACCGATEDDPCENLIIGEDGKSRCRDYEHRFGPHKTKSGIIFMCVPLRWIIHQSWPGDHLCIYKRKNQAGNI